VSGHTKRATPKVRASEHRETFTLNPIGVVRSPFKVHEGTPRQPGTGEVRDGEIRLFPGFQNALKDLAGFSHVWVVFWFHLSRGWNSQVVPPRDVKKRGLFATRAPHRPNPIGLSVVRLLQIQGLTLRVRGLDMLDGTPVLDIKPYVPYVDAIPDAKAGWLDTLGDSAGPDHRLPPENRRPARSRRPR
jgi:tRNA-Thr(GGU) m(6)t(6)A37 methyltransferase TsaA